MAKVIVVTNRKGGVGKTTTAVHLAAGYTSLGYKVAIVDTDPQGHVSLALGMSKKENGLYNLMVDEDYTFSDVLRYPDPARYGQYGVAIEQPLAVLPSSKHTVVIPLHTSSIFGFRNKLEDMGDLLELDMIIVDTSPTQSLLDGAVHFAADYLLYVTEYAKLSFDGLSESIQELQNIHAENRAYRSDEVHMLGIVPNKSKFTTLAHREMATRLGKRYQNMSFSPISNRTLWEAAQNNGQTVFSYAPDSVEAMHGWRLVKETLERMGVPADSLHQRLLQIGVSFDRLSEEGA